MAATKRLHKELADIRKDKLLSNIFKNICVDEKNVLLWTGFLVPDNFDSTPKCDYYKNGAFKIDIMFPAEYPFKPPKITFKTKIYHPNIDDNGNVCLPIITAENWKPATKTDKVITELMQLVCVPEPEHPLRTELAEEYLKDRKKFIKNAEAHTKKHSERMPLPAD